MAAINRTIAFTLTLLLTVFGAAVAQDDQNKDAQNKDQQQASTVNGEEFVPYGEINVGQPEPFDTDERQVDVEIETGALIFTGETPGDQHPNVDLIGPDGYVNHFEIDDNADEEHVIDGLVPGVYSVAATDDNLQLAHTLVEVVRGQAVRVNVTLDQRTQDFVPGAFAGDDAARPVFPANSFQARRGDIDSELGQITVETDDDEGTFVVTGPDNYYQEFNGSFTAEDLQPGVYVIAGTKEGSQIATTSVEVEATVASTLVPAFVVVPTTAETDEEGDVAGGGEADEEQDQEELEMEVPEQDDEQQNENDNN